MLGRTSDMICSCREKQPASERACTMESKRRRNRVCFFSCVWNGREWSDQKEEREELRERTNLTELCDQNREYGLEVSEVLKNKVGCLRGTVKILKGFAEV